MDLRTLQTLTELKYQKSLSGLSDILAREAKLRGELAQLRRHTVEAQSLPVAAHSMRNIGADVIWLQWVAKATRSLNIELAQVLAQKESLLANQRRALGRRTVASNLASDADTRKQAERKASALQRAIEYDVARRLQDQ
ncbi:MAG: hypothetical protein AAFQ59_01145 [Pseudomonadota bacterium]